MQEQRMSQLQSTADSSERARLLLAAWNCGDPTTRLREVENAVVLQPAAGLPSMEYERWELLDGIAVKMRNAITCDYRRSAGCDVEVSLQLLHHLVAQGR
jgi:hypothetical protein